MILKLMLKICVCWQVLLVRLVDSITEAGKDPTRIDLHRSCAELFESDLWASKSWMTHRTTSITAECSLHHSFFPFLETRHGAADRDAKVWRIYSAIGFYESDVDELPIVPRPYCGTTGTSSARVGPSGAEAEATHWNAGELQGDCAFASLPPPIYWRYESWAQWYEQGRGRQFFPLVLNSRRRIGEHPTAASGNVDDPLFFNSLPYLFVIGAQKGGTTHLRRILSRHPRLFSIPGDGRFFQWPRLSVLQESAAAYAPGSRSRTFNETLFMTYSTKFAFDHRLLLSDSGKNDNVAIKGQSEPLFFDSTPYYLVSPFAPLQISSILPHARFVVLLREPSERFLSNMRMELCRVGVGKRGNQSDTNVSGRGLDYTTIEEYMVNAGFYRPGELVRYLNQHATMTVPHMKRACHTGSPGWTSLWSCMALRSSMMPLAKGLYAELLQMWFRCFKRHQFYITQSEMYFKNPSWELESLLAFAGLSGSHEFGHSPGLLTNERWPVGVDKPCQQGHDMGINSLLELFMGSAHDPTSEFGGLDALLEFYAGDKEKLGVLLGDDFAWRPWGKDQGGLRGGAYHGAHVE
mmetsp:Transcript_104087/g.299763  ORF Transcript_104087/g.299763 Transcript_104087/m.299763 type:complete len:578 (-) Transcript_104087:90-1823(-)